VSTRHTVKPRLRTPLLSASFRRSWIVRRGRPNEAIRRSRSRSAPARRGRRCRPPPSVRRAGSEHSSRIYGRCRRRNARSVCCRRERLADETAGSADAAARRSISLLEQALTAARATAGRAEAADRAFDAYALAFERSNHVPRARRSGVVSSHGAVVHGFRVAVRSSDVAWRRARARCHRSDMPKSVELTRPAGSASEAFLQSLLHHSSRRLRGNLCRRRRWWRFLLKTGNRSASPDDLDGHRSGAGRQRLTAVVLRTILKAIPARKVRTSSWDSHSSSPLACCSRELFG